MPYYTRGLLYQGGAPPEDCDRFACRRCQRLARRFASRHLPRTQDLQRISMDLALMRCVLSDLTTMSQTDITVLHWRRIGYLVQKPEAQPQRQWEDE